MKNSEKSGGAEFKHVFSPIGLKHRDNYHNFHSTLKEKKIRTQVILIH